MPLAALLGKRPDELAAIGGSPSVLPQHTVLVGIRNLDDREKDQIRDSGVHVFTMKDIDREGIARVAEEALALASAGTGGLHVSFDMDVCDPTIAPGVGTPVKGGLNYREAHLLMELVADSRTLVGLDLVEVNPTLDLRNTTAELGAELALSALGKGNPVASPRAYSRARSATPVSRPSAFFGRRRSSSPLAPARPEKMIHRRFPAASARSRRAPTPARDGDRRSRRPAGADA
jgi:hypothetical protein